MVYARGMVGALRPLATTSHLSPAAMQATLDLTRASTATEASAATTGLIDERIEAGSVLHIRQWATNRAGRASSVLAKRAIMLDDTPPRPPQLRPCEATQRTYNGVYYQRGTEGILICWQAPGFADGESGIDRLEWQLARRVAAGVMDTLTPTQRIESVAWPQVGLSDGLNGPARLLLSSESINTAVGMPLALHGTHFRVGLRAVNRGACMASSC